MFSTIFADTITIKIGNTVLYLGTNLIVYVAVAAIVGLVAEFLIGWRLPFGIIGATIAALIGIWIMTQVIVISGIPDYAIQYHSTNLPGKSYYWSCTIRVYLASFNLSTLSQT